MGDDPDPPRKFYGLKPKEFERVNAPRPPATQPAEPASAQSASPPPPDAPIDVRDLARTAARGTPLLQGNAPANRPNEVHALLADNLQRANAAGLNEVTPVKKRPSRRKRDYLLVLIAVNAFFAFWAFGPYRNPMTFVYGIAGMILFSIAFTWVMFAIVDEY